MKFAKKIAIGRKVISAAAPVFIIAEAGVNHNGDLSRAEKLIDTAVAAGVDAVKFQSFKTEELILKGVAKAPYQKAALGQAGSQYEMLKKLELTDDEQLRLKKYCDRRGIIFLTTPFDNASLAALDRFALPAYKIASTDLTNLPFLKAVARRGRPVILSTGMSYLKEIDAALREIYPLNRQVILLQCTANYPVRDEEVNLKIIDAYRQKYDILVGFSDHTVGVGAAPYAVALGARVVEKHFTLDKGLPGPDHKASLDPAELAEFVRAVRQVEKYLGTAVKAPTSAEKRTRLSLQKSLVASREINKGAVIREGDLVAKRTGGAGLSPLHYRELIGKKAKRHYAKDDIL